MEYDEGYEYPINYWNKSVSLPHISGKCALLFPLPPHNKGKKGPWRSFFMQSKPWTLGSDHFGCKFKNISVDLQRTQEQKNRKDGEIEKDEQNDTMIREESISRRRICHNRNSFIGSFNSWSASRSLCSLYFPLSSMSPPTFRWDSERE